MTTKRIKQSAGLIVEFAGKVLLLRRSEKKSLFPGLWNIPGGSAEDGESISQTASRELYEEAGVHIEPGSLSEICVAEYSLESKILYFHVFGIQLEQKPSVKINEESEEYGWFTKEEAISLNLVINDRESLLSYFAKMGEKQK